jgi:hypothetical protein
VSGAGCRAATRPAARPAAATPCPAGVPPAPAARAPARLALWSRSADPTFRPHEDGGRATPKWATPKLGCGFADDALSPLSGGRLTAGAFRMGRRGSLRPRPPAGAPPPPRTRPAARLRARPPTRARRAARPSGTSYPARSPRSPAGPAERCIGNEVTGRIRRRLLGTETRSRAVGASGDAPPVLPSVHYTIPCILLRTLLPRPSTTARRPGHAGGSAASRRGLQSWWVRYVAV